MAGQEPEERVQAGTRPASPWPVGMAECDFRVSCISTTLPRTTLTGGDRYRGAVSVDQDKPEEATKSAGQKRF